MSDRNTTVIGHLRKKVKTLQRCVQRQRTKIQTMNDLIDELQDKRLIESDSAAVLRNCLDGSVLEFVQNQIANNNRTPKGRRYTQAIKQFALTLHYYSPQAYRYCRTIFALPDPSSIRNWLSSIDGKPGFMTDIIKAFGTLPHEYRDCSLVIDSMSLRKQTLYDDVDGKYVGFCDFGGLIAEDPDTVASEALVFILVPLRGSTKYIVGYFLVDKVNARIQTELVKTALQLTANHGIRVRNITCDGAAANISMFTMLGCDMNPVHPTTSFKHPHFEHQVHATLDICHMLKLARNALAEMKYFSCNNGTLIKWSYIDELVKLQDAVGLKLGNKLSTTHVQWYVTSITFNNSLFELMLSRNQPHSDIIYLHSVCSYACKFM